MTGYLENSGATLTLSGANNVLTFQGATIHGGTVVTTNGATLLVQNATLDGVTINGTLDVGNTYSANLTVTNGLVLNGMALVGNPTNGAWGRIDFPGRRA